MNVGCVNDKMSYCRVRKKQDPYDYDAPPVETHAVRLYIMQHFIIDTAVEYNNLYTHFIFTTLNRMPIILKNIATELKSISINKRLIRKNEVMRLGILCNLLLLRLFCF